MLEIIHLDDRHGADLYKFLLLHKDVGGLLLIQKRDKFLNASSGAAIACVENRKTIKQVVLCEFKDLTCFTRGIMGDFGEYSLNLLDGLCARCSSNDPMIVNHKMVIQPNHFDNFKTIWPKTRLGKMAFDESWAGIVFRANIEYPI